MNNNFSNKIFFFFKAKLLFCFFIIGFIIIPGTSNSQTESENDPEEKGVDPVLPLNKFIKNSQGIVENKLLYDGKLYGYEDGERIFIRDYLSQETFSFETLDYDSIQFFYEWDDYVVDGFFIKVLDNQPFEYKTSPIMQMSGADLVVANNQMKDLFLKENGAGKKLYSVTITDDVNPDLVKVEPLQEASLYIDVVKLDSSTYHIKIKDKTVFLGNLSEDIKNKWSKGEEIKFPIGIVMTDTVLTDHTASISYSLVKQKKPKKIKN